MEPVRYGIIGTGMMGRGHAECLKHVGASRLAAVADPHEESLEFIECIHTGRAPFTGLEDARFSTLVGLAAEESARNGGSVVTL